MQSDRHRLLHIVEAIRRCLDYTAGMTFLEFSADAKTIVAVVRNLMIIGEASYKLSPEMLAKARNAPFAEAAKMRHVLVHDYVRVDSQVVWTAVHAELPAFLMQVRALLESDKD
jgi:uncharacterized protein with HEPN domain